MNKLFALLVLIVGLVAGVMFFVAGADLSKASTDLTGLRSVGGTSVAEAYYQGSGKQGLAYSIALYACGLGILAVSLGLGGLLLSDSNTRNNIKSEANADGSLPFAQ